MAKYERGNQLKLPIINERFLTIVLKLLASNVVVSKKLLGNIDYLLELIDMNYYSKDLTVFSLIQSIKIASKQRQNSATFNREVLISEISAVISEQFEEQKVNIILPSILMADKTTSQELSLANKIIDIYLKYATIILTKEKMSSALNEISSGNLNNLEVSIDKYRNVVESVSEEFRKTDSVVNSNMINSTDDEFVDILMETYDQVKNPKYSLKTGLKYLNQLLSEEGGFRSSCFYIFYASINSFKSGILQYSQKWIRKYNSENYLKMFNETGLIPTVLFYSFENTRTENMQREFYMETEIQLKDVSSPEEAKRLWTEHYNSTNSIINTCYVYAEANTVRVSDMRRQIHALNESGYKVIAVIADYLELIRPEDEDAHLETRLKLGYISNAFHVMAVAEDVVGITAQQMNRAAETTMSELRNKGQSNIIEQVGGMQFIGESYSIEKPADFSAYIATERSVYDNKLYLTIKRGKCRYKPGDIRYFVTELKNGFYIEDDYGTDKISSKMSIMPTLDSEVKEITETVSETISRPKILNRTIRDKKVERKVSTSEETKSIIDDILNGDNKMEVA